MKCTKYNIGNILPPYIKKNGFMTPCIPANFEQLGIFERVDAVPDEGKNITQSHGELINGQWVEVIDEQKTPAEIAKAEALEVNKFSKLAVVEACIVLGIWSGIRAAIKAEQDVSDCWDACNEVNTEYGRTADFLKANLTKAQINAIKLKIAGL